MTSPTPFLSPETALPVAIPSSVLAQPVRGRGLVGGTGAEQLGPRPVALVFLRHFG